MGDEYGEEGGYNPGQYNYQFNNQAAGYQYNAEPAAPDLGIQMQNVQPGAGQQVPDEYGQNSFENRLQARMQQMRMNQGMGGEPEQPARMGLAQAMGAQNGGRMAFGEPDVGIGAPFPPVGGMETAGVVPGADGEGDVEVVAKSEYEEFMEWKQRQQEKDAKQELKKGRKGRRKERKALKEKTKKSDEEFWKKAQEADNAFLKDIESRRLSIEMERKKKRAQEKLSEKLGGNDVHVPVPVPAVQEQQKIIKRFDHGYIKYEDEDTMDGGQKGVALFFCTLSIALRIIHFYHIYLNPLNATFWVFGIGLIGVRLVTDLCIVGSPIWVGRGFHGPWWYMAFICICGLGNAAGSGVAALYAVWPPCHVIYQGFVTVIGIGGALGEYIEKNFVSYNSFVGFLAWIPIFALTTAIALVLGLGYQFLTAILLPVLLTIFWELKVFIWWPAAWDFCYVWFMHAKEIGDAFSIEDTRDKVPDYFFAEITMETTIEYEGESMRNLKASTVRGRMSQLYVALLDEILWEGTPFFIVYLIYMSDARQMISYCNYNATCAITIPLEFVIICTQMLWLFYTTVIRLNQDGLAGYEFADILLDMAQPKPRG